METVTVRRISGRQIALPDDVAVAVGRIDGDPCSAIQFRKNGMVTFQFALSPEARRALAILLLDPNAGVPWEYTASRSLRWIVLEVPDQQQADKP